MDQKQYLVLILNYLLVTTNTFYVTQWAEYFKRCRRDIDDEELKERPYIQIPKLN